MRKVILATLATSAALSVGASAALAAENLPTSGSCTVGGKTYNVSANWDGVSSGEPNAYLDYMVATASQTAGFNSLSEITYQLSYITTFDDGHRETTTSPPVLWASNPHGEGPSRRDPDLNTWKATASFRNASSGVKCTVTMYNPN